MKKLLIITAGILFFAATSCSNSSDDLDFEYDMTYIVNLDNALDTTAIVVITEEGKDSAMTFEVDGFSLKKIELKAGKYNVTAKTVTDSSFLNDKFELSTGYSFNLNLTKQDYILERVTYVVSENPESYMINKSFTYNGKTYEEVDATVIKGKLLVENSWDYNLEDEMPQEVEISNSASTTTKTKLYRAETFVLYLELFELFNNMNAEDVEEFEALETF